MKEAVSDTLVHIYTPVVKHEPVGELDTTTGEVRIEMQRHTIDKKDTVENLITPDHSQKRSEGRQMTEG